MRTNQQLKDLHLPRCDWRFFIKFTGEGDPKPQEIEDLNQHFLHFVNPGPCIKCGEKLGADNVLEAAIGIGTFTWGIGHGEGFCRKCLWPARGIHYDVGPIAVLKMILQYHPDIVSWDKEK